MLYDEADGGDLASSLLSSVLWTRLTGANVVVQVYNKTPIVEVKHQAILQEMTDHQVRLIFPTVPQQDEDVCDMALESTISRMLLFSKLTPRQAETGNGQNVDLYFRLSEDDIILISDPDIFISIPSYLNVLQSSHQAWLFFSEIMFYGYLPWETLIAATTANWRS